MPYIGKEPVRGQNRELDDISGSFNGGNTAFTMQVGGINTTTGSVNQLFISVGGVLQNPGTDFTVASSTITFTTPPASGLDFWGIIQGDAVDINTPADSSVSTVKIIDNAVTGAKVAMGSDAQGDVLYYNGTDYARLGAGTSGHYLKTQGTGANPVWAAVSDSDTLSHRNIIINGGMLVAQRGTSSGDGGYKTVDRWSAISSNTDELAFDQKQTTDYPSGFSKCYEIDITTAESALAANELFYLRHKIEAQNLRPFYNNDGTGKNFTLSFWVKAKQTGTYQVSIHKEDNTVRFISATYTVSSAETWEKKTINITGDTGTSGVNADNGQGFDISWKLAAGTDYTSGTPQTTWGSFSNAVFAAGHAVNVADNAANYFRITGVQLELGDTATDFESRSYADELIKCQRYYWKKVGTQWAHAGFGLMASTTQVRAYVEFPVTMRAVPTLSGSGMYVDSETTSTFNVTGFDSSYLYNSGGQARLTTDTASFGAGTPVNIGLNSTTAYFAGDAEL